jgi:hypothetical protein
MVEGTKRGLMIEVHHVDALRDYAEATQDDLGKLAKRISEQTTFLWNRMESRGPFFGTGWSRSAARRRSNMP